MEKDKAEKQKLMKKAKNPKVAIVSKEWEGAPETLIDITWE